MLSAVSRGRSLGPKECTGAFWPRGGCHGQALPTAPCHRKANDVSYEGGALPDLAQAVVHDVSPRVSQGGVKLYVSGCQSLAMEEAGEPHVSPCASPGKGMPCASAGQALLTDEGPQGPTMHIASHAAEDISPERSRSRDRRRRSRTVYIMQLVAALVFLVSALHKALEDADRARYRQCDEVINSAAAEDRGVAFRAGGRWREGAENTSWRGQALPARKARNAFSCT